MMPPRWLAFPLVVLTGCATATGITPGPRLLSSDLHIGALDQRTRFELDDRGSAPTAKSETAADSPEDSPKKERRRKLLYYTGLGAIGFGVLGSVSFGIGGRIVQAQLKKGYEDGTLTRDREDQLHTTGTVMNGMAIGSAVVGLLGVITAATIYGIDYSRCGELPPRRKNCPGKAEPAAPAPAEPAATASETTPPSADTPPPAEPGAGQ